MKRKIYSIALLSFVLSFPAIFAQTPGTAKWIYTAPNAITSSGAVIGSDQTVYFSDWQHTMYAISGSGSLKWMASAPSGYFTGDNSPAMSKDGSVVYFQIFQIVNNLFTGYGGITARRASDGAELWTYYDNSGGADITGPAVANDGTIYFAGGMSLHAITSSGVEKWSVSFGDDYDNETYTAAPAVGPDGTVYVGVNGQGLYGLNPVDGSQKVLCHTDGGGVNSPTFGADGTIYVGGYGGLYAFDPDGTRKWKYSNTSLAVQFPAQNGAPVGSDGTIYFQCRGYLYAINPNGTLKWQFSTENSEQVSYDSCPAIASDGTIYVGSASYKLYAVNADGTLRWAYTTGNKMYSPVAIGDDGVVYIGSLDHKFYAIYGAAPLAVSPWPKYHADKASSGRQNYYVLLNANQSDYTFQAGITYYVSNSISISGQTILEGGAIIKYRPGTSITAVDLDCETSVNNPAVFTARDDDSVGAMLSDSTHSPSGHYANSALLINTESDVVLHDVKFYYVGTGIEMNFDAYNDPNYTGDYTDPNLSLWNVVVQHSGAGVYLDNGGVLCVTNLTMSDYGGIGDGYDVNGSISSSSFANGGFIQDSWSYFFNPFNFYSCTFSNVTLSSFELDVDGDNNGFHGCTDFSDYDYQSSPDKWNDWLDYFGSDWYYY